MQDCHQKQGRETEKEHMQEEENLRKKKKTVIIISNIKYYIHGMEEMITSAIAK